MNWDAIGAIGEIVGAIAVILSLIYLALQIRQNTTTTQGSNELVMSRSVANWVSKANIDAHLRRAWGKLADGEELSSDEMAQILWYVSEWLHLCEGWYQLYRRGLMSESIWTARSNGALGLLKQDFVLSWWNAEGISVSTEFRSYMNTQLKLGKANWTMYPSRNLKTL